MKGAPPRWTRHSLVLSIAGTIYVIIGVAFFYVPAEVSKAPSLKVALTYLSLDEWGWVFIVCGALAILAAFSTLGHKAWGYMVLTALSSAWATMYAMAIIFKHAPILTVVSVMTWFMLAFVWWGVSGLLSPEHARYLAEEHHRELRSD